MEPLPYEADIEPTTRCNLKCVMCQTILWQHKRHDMDIDLFCRIIGQIPSLRKVKLQGMGEPLLHPGLPRMIVELRKRDVFATTVTNGVLLEANQRQALFESGLNRLYISLDTFDPATFCRIRGSDQLKTLIKNLEQALTEAPTSTEVCTMTLAMKDNADELIDLVGRVAEMGIRHVAIQVDLTEWGKQEWSCNKDRNVPTIHIADIIREIQVFCQQRAIDLELIRNRHLMKGQKCLWPFHQVYITCDGDVQPCCKVSDPLLFTFGNVRNTSFAYIWNSKAYRQFRNAFCTGNPYSLCKECYV